MTNGTLFSYVFPPLLGAGIGYLTNAVAIRMLFRPLEPWRIFGWRLPLTPGIIPAKRRLLAEKIGKMVGEHLLTPGDVAEALEKEAFLRELRGAVGSKLDQWLHQDVGPVDSLVADAHREHLHQLLSVLNHGLTQAVFTYLGTEEFQEKLSVFLQSKEDDFLAHDLESILDQQSLEKLERNLSERLEDWLRSDHLEQLLERSIERRIDQFLETEKTLREILPEKLVVFAMDQIDRLVPLLLEKSSRQLYTTAVRQELTVKVQTAIKSFMDSLKGLSGFFAGLINLEKINAKIPDFLDHTGNELYEWLEKGETREHLSRLVQGKIAELLDHSPGALLQKIPYEKVVEARKIFVRQIVETARSPQWKDYLSSNLKSSFHRVKDTSLRGLLEKILSPDGLEKSRHRIVGSILAGLRSEQAKETFSTLLLENFEHWVMKRPTGKLCDYIPVTVRDWIEENAYRYLVELIKKEIPAFIESFNIQKMVREKVDSLDILAVEGLLLGIMQEHFVYINLFGALLGFIIGSVNVVV